MLVLHLSKHYVNNASICVVLIYVYIIQAVLGGVLRGCGKQLHVAIINVCSYYLLGLPLGLTLVYAADMGALGFYLGCTVGCYTQVCIIPPVTV